MVRHRLTLLSSISLTGPQGPVLVGKKKALALLAYLATTAPHRTPRTHLGGLLWEDKAPEQSMNSLRQTLSDIRRALPQNTGLIDIGRQEIALDPSSLDTDIDLLLASVDSGEIRPELTGHQSICDRLLEDIEGIGSGFDLSIFEFRTRMERQLKSALGTAAAAVNRPIDQRLDAARALTQLDPLSEEGCRWLMQIWAEQGETGAALHAYSELYDKLDAELGMEPSDQTQDLAVRIKTGEFSTTPEPSPAAPITDGPPFLGGAPRLAVMPFRALGPDHAPEFLLQGIADDIVCMMATLSEVHVISSNSSGLSASDRVRETATALGAQYVVLGSIRAAHGRFHLSVQLVELANNIVHWARAYTAEEAELFDVQADIASSIANTLVPFLHKSELRRTRGFEPTDLTAYHLTLRARDLAFRLQPDSFFEARELLQSAVSRDPLFTPAHIALADWYSISLGQGWSADTNTDLVSLDASASEALRLSGDSGRALALFAHNRTIYKDGAQQSLGMIRQALEQAPSDAETLMWSVPTLTYSGHLAQAVEYAHRAISLSPRDPYLFRYEHFLAAALYAQGDVSEARSAALRSLDKNRDYTSNLRLAIAAQWEMGRTEEAYSLAQHAKERDPSFRISRFLPNQPFHQKEIGLRYAQSLIHAGIPE